MRALEGKRVLVTRPRAQVHLLADALKGLGADVAVLPTIEIAAPDSFEDLDRALADLGGYDWMVLTSVNGVRAVADRLEVLRIPVSKFEHLKLAAIGPATAKAMAGCLREPDLVPGEFVSEAIAEAIPDVEGRRFLLARADIARRDLAVLLRERGARVDEVIAYRIVPSAGPFDLGESAPDYITLTSSSAARSAARILRENGRAEWLSRAGLITIGPITSATVRELGLEVAAEAAEYTVPGLVETLVEHVRKEPTHA